MKHYNKNGIDILLKKTPKTPRISVCLFFKINQKEKYYGVNSLLARLLLQGTKKYSAVQLNNEFENECIDISFKAKQDYIKASLIFLNEDFKKAMELLRELLLNSTFDDFDKEIFKIKGEIVSDLDSPKLKMVDSFIKTIFKEHPYSSTHTKILDDIDKITKEDVIEAHKLMMNSEKAIVMVGDYSNEEEMLEYFANNFAFMNSQVQKNEIDEIFKANIKEDEIVWLSKNDAAQAQIIQGWLIDSFKSEDYPKIAILNNILGSSGLSSRLFINLRDKQGLAYTVRSQYETLLRSAIFNMYIGVDPKNIQKSLDGFRIELEKLATEKIEDKELTSARENISGRLKYFTQNNSQIASVEGYNFIMGLGLNHNKEFLEAIGKVTSEDINRIAKKLLSLPKVVVIIAPDEYKF